MDRRNFLKTSGIIGLGFMEPGNMQRACASVMPGQAKQENPSKIFNMCGYAAPKLHTVRIGIIGIGARGRLAVDRLSQIEGVEIKALCDIRKEKLDKVKKESNYLKGDPALFAGDKDIWKEVCQRADIDLIYVATPWSLHAPMGIYGMECGKHVALEVPAATTVEDCWRLVQTSEKTKKHCVMLENCCYDSFELLTLNLARNGFFGEIIHCEGGYIHNICENLFHRGRPDNNWHLEENMTRNGNLYPTHGLGPIAQVMNINRGNKMNRLVSMSSNDFSMGATAKILSEKDSYFQQFTGASFRGNINTSVIKTEKGQTILLQHDISSPRPYSRIHTISGTKAFAQKYPLPPRIARGNKWISDEEFKELEQKYDPVSLAGMAALLPGKIGGHGNMDFLMDWRLIYCLRNGLPVDIDVYDAAAWSAIAPLSELSVAKQSATVEIPDFTKGRWTENSPYEILQFKQQV